MFSYPEHSAIRPASAPDKRGFSPPATTGAARVVEIGETVCEARPEMKKRRGGFLGHAPIAVSGTRRDTLKKAQDRAQSVHLVDARDEMNLGRARVGEADRDACAYQRPDDTLGTVHPPLPALRAKPAIRRMAGLLK